MPIISERSQVVAVYAEAAQRGWVLPAFNSENQTTSEAILAAASEYGRQRGLENLPIIIGITNNYPDRPQSCYYTQSGRWDIGLRLFLDDLRILASADSPYADLRLMIHLDHIQWDKDRQLLGWDLKQFSSIMFDASTLPLDQNIKKTAEFVKQFSDDLLIEGACDEIGAFPDADNLGLTKPEQAYRYQKETGVDILVVNLGTEHRASAADLHYHADLAREISALTGARLCLHGTSSLPVGSLSKLFSDGIRRVNLWTALERESSVLLFEDMITNAAKITGSERTLHYISEGLLGTGVDTESRPSIDYFTTTYRQNKIFQYMKINVLDYLKLFYP